MSTRDQILQLRQRMAESIIGQEQVIERLLLTTPGIHSGQSDKLERCGAGERLTTGAPDTCSVETNW